MKLNETSMRVGRLSRKLLSIDENFDLEEDKQCPRNISSWFCTISTRILSWKSKIHQNSHETQWTHERGGSLLPKSPPFDEKFDLEGGKVCSNEILPSSDTIETLTMPKNSKTHIYIEGIHPWMQLSQNRPSTWSNMTPLSHSGVQDYFNTMKLTVFDDHMATDPSVS